MRQSRNPAGSGASEERMSIKSSSHVDTKFYCALPDSGPATSMSKTLSMRNDDSRENAKPKKKQLISRKWASPSIMVSYFTLGIVLALGHHLYYQWLNGQVVGDLTRQQWSLRLVFTLFFSIPLD